MRTENEQLEKEVDELEHARADKEEASRGLEESRRSLDRRFAGCQNPTWRIGFRDVMGDAEAKRRALEVAREQLMSLQRTLEDDRNHLQARRRNIETQYSNLQNAKEYELAFLEYVDDFRVDYIKRVRRELFYGYDEYRNGIATYIELVGRACDACEGIDSERDVRGFAGFIKGIGTAAENITRAVARASSLRPTR